MYEALSILLSCLALTLTLALLPCLYPPVSPLLYIIHILTIPPPLPPLSTLPSLTTPTPTPTYNYTYRYKYQLLYVYTTTYQAGGYMWIAAYKYSLLSLIGGILTLLCYLAIRRSFLSEPFYALMPLPVLVYVLLLLLLL